MCELGSFVIAPNKVTEAVMLSNSVAEPAAGETVWNASTNYTAGTYVIRTQTHKKYKALVGGVDSTPPENALIATSTVPAKWLEVGSTNRWAAFDSTIGSQTIDASGTLTIELLAEAVEGIALLELKGQRVRITMYETTAVGAQVVFQSDDLLDGSIIDSVYSWLFTDYIQRRNYLRLDLPAGYWKARLKIEIFGSSGAGVGAIVIGKSIRLGCPQFGAGVGIINFGKVASDDFGNRQWLEGTYARRITLPIMSKPQELSRLDRQLSALRSTPAVYIGCTHPDYEALICFGVYKDLYITTQDFSRIALNLEIEGLNNV